MLDHLARNLLLEDTRLKVVIWLEVWRVRHDKQPICLAEGREVEEEDIGQYLRRGDERETANQSEQQRAELEMWQAVDTRDPQQFGQLNDVSCARGPHRGAATHTRDAGHPAATLPRRPRAAPCACDAHAARVGAVDEVGCVALGHVMLDEYVPVLHAGQGTPPVPARPRPTPNTCSHTPS
eukprot:603936-Prymnesium_polylepis.2